MPVRRPSTHSAQAWSRAEQLVVEKGMTLEAAATRAGIPLGTLKPRAAKEEWVALREGRKEYATLVTSLKVKALKAAIASPSKESIDAWAVIERAYPEKTYNNEALATERIIEAMESFTLWLSVSDTDPAFMSDLELVLGRYFADLEA